MFIQTESFDYNIICNV